MALRAGGWMTAWGCSTTVSVRSGGLRVVYGDVKAGRQRHSEELPAAVRRLGPHPASLEDDQVLDDGQPQPGPGHLPVASGVDLVEALEDPIPVLGRDAVAV